MLRSLIAGLLLGGFVAAQVGPVSLLCIRTATRSGFRPAWAIGAGAATVDACYAALGVLGAAALVQIEPVRLLLGLAGAAVLAWMGVRTLLDAWRIRSGGEAAFEVADVAASYRTGLIATASNPLTIISWAAIFGAAATASLLETAPAAVALLAGVLLGSAAWFLVLAAVATKLGRRLGRRMLLGIDVTVGIGLLGFAGILGVRTVQDA
ncbi:MAG TPA: LysE family transporter [Actinomycetes bacterium]|nr:LysE family transporter [Actinomycetes bacterium]